MNEEKVFNFNLMILEHSLCVGSTFAFSSFLCFHLIFFLFFLFCSEIYFRRNFSQVLKLVNVTFIWALYIRKPVAILKKNEDEIPKHSNEEATDEK